MKIWINLNTVIKSKSNLIEIGFDTLILITWHNLDEFQYTKSLDQAESNLKRISKLLQLKITIIMK